MKLSLRKIIFATIITLLIINSLIQFSSRYMRVGHIVEIRTDAVVVKGSGAQEPSYVLTIENGSKFYNLQGDQINISELKLGSRVRVKLFPHSDGMVFMRKQKTIRWLKVLAEN